MEPLVKHVSSESPCSPGRPVEPPVSPWRRAARNTHPNLSNGKVAAMTAGLTKMKAKGTFELLAAVLFIVSAVLVSSVLAGSASAADPPDGAIDNSATEIGVAIQEYEGDDVAEILIIRYDGEQKVLEEFGGLNPEIEMVNHEIEAQPLKLYHDFQDGKLGDSLEIRSYPFIDDDLIQIITSTVVYPETRPDLYSNLWSYNFSKAKNQFVMIDNILEDLNISREDISKKFNELYKSDFENEKIVEVQTTGFLIDNLNHKAITYLFLNVTLELESDPYSSFFIYSPVNNSLEILEPKCMFNPKKFKNMAPMDPPLAYMGQDCL